MVLQNLAGEPSRNVVNPSDIWDLGSWQWSIRKMQLLTAWEFWSEGTLIENTLPVTIPTDNLFHTACIHWQKRWKISTWVYIRARWVWLNKSQTLRTPTFLDGDFQDLILPSEVPPHNSLYVWVSGEGLSAVPKFCRVRIRSGAGQAYGTSPKLLVWQQLGQTNAPLAFGGAFVLLQLQEASPRSSACSCWVSMKLLREMGVGVGSILGLRSVMINPLGDAGPDCSSQHLQTSSQTTKSVGFAAKLDV